MGGVKRILNIAMAVVMACCAFWVFFDRENGYLLVVTILEIGLLVLGIQQLVYYFTMARHMVDGLKVFYKGVLLVDAGIFAICLGSLPRTFAMVYLLAAFGAAGGIGIVRSFEMKGLGAKWKPKFASGVIEVLIALACVVFVNSNAVFSCVFAVGLLYLAVEKVATAFQKTAIVYVETQSAEDAVAAS